MHDGERTKSDKKKTILRRSHSSETMLFFSYTHVHSDRLCQSVNWLDIYENSKKINGKAKTYNSRHSLVVTHPTTSLPI